MLNVIYAQCQLLIVMLNVVMLSIVAPSLHLRVKTFQGQTLYPNWSIHKFWRK
jgi:hypothetical protein